MGSGIVLRFPRSGRIDSHIGNAGGESRVVGASYPVTHELLAFSSANVVLVAEHRGRDEHPRALKATSVVSCSSWEHEVTFVRSCGAGAASCRSPCAGSRTCPRRSGA